MTPEEQAELRILMLANEKHKFAISVAADLTLEETAALERLQLRSWIKLIDVSSIAAALGVYRIFMIMPSAINWMRKHSKIS